MTKRLRAAIEKLKTLPAERQDEIAEIIFHMAEADADDPLFSDEQWEEVRRRMAAPRDYASDQDVEAFFRKYGK